MKVYLAGGMRGDWHDKVIQAIGTDNCLDPRHHKGISPTQFTLRDLYYIRICDVVLAYMEADNPSGLGLAGEIGYARALGKVIILVDNKSTVDAQFDRYFAIIREMADITFNSLDDAIDFLCVLQPH